MVGELLCYILQASEATWKACRGLMADAGFVNTLQQMDCEAIPQKNINAIKGNYLIDVLILSVSQL